MLQLPDLVDVSSPSFFFILPFPIVIITTTCANFSSSVTPTTPCPSEYSTDKTTLPFTQQKSSSTAPHLTVVASSRYQLPTPTTAPLFRHNFLKLTAVSSKPLFTWNQVAMKSCLSTVLGFSSTVGQ